ncbi:MAG: hypothetical protein Q4A61_00740 [Porphyromonadaceae bacterium]|nr:hypothetical protein [Porphyromonadaceae bacterium]
MEIKNRYTGETILSIEADTLSDANLRGADLSGARTSQRFVTVACIGSRKGQTTYCFDTDTIWCGCFRGSLEEFECKVEETHLDHPQYLHEYRATIAYIRALMSNN